MAIRVAMISYHTCPLASEEGKETGGMNVYILELGKVLAGLGVAVDVFTRSQDPGNTPVVEVVPGFRVIHTVAGPQTPVDKKALMPYVQDFADAVTEFAAKESVTYDILHAHYYLSGLIALKIQKMMSGSPKPVIVSFHTLALMKNLVARDDAEKEDDARIEAEMLLGREATRIIANSESDGNYLEYLYGIPRNRLTIIPPGVNASIFRPIPMSEARAKIQVSDGHKLILFVGRIEPLKGIDMLLYAAKILTVRSPHLPICVCVVGGDITPPHLSWSKTLQSLNAIRHTLNLSATVTFVGQKSQDILPYFYNAADIVVMPSHYESFGMAALEAMACGTPVITTNASGISGLIDEKHASLITPVNNPLLLANQIEAMLTSPQNRNTVGAEIRENVLDLTWDTTAKRLRRVYEEVIA